MNTGLVKGFAVSFILAVSGAASAILGLDHGLSGYFLGAFVGLTVSWTLCALSVWCYKKIRNGR